MKIKTIITSGIAMMLFTASSHGITIYGLSATDQLYMFDSASPGSAVAVGATAGNIAQIDYRGSNGLLYGMAGTGETYTINTATGASTSLFTPQSSLGGSVTGFDFNPAVDRMRLAVGGTKNFRMVPDNIPGMTAGTVVNGTAGDGTYGVPLSVTILDVAYLNPFTGPVSGTNLFSIGSDGILYNHTVGPQFNTMTAVGSGLGFVPVGSASFDIAPDGTGYLVNGSNFYSVNLATGSASLLGSLGQSFKSVSAVPEPTSLLMGAIGGLVLLRRRRCA